MLHEAEIIDQFRRAMAEQGVMCSDEILADGHFHRIHVEGDKKASRNAWYILHMDERPAGAFGCNKRFGPEARFNWKAEVGSIVLSPVERVKFKADLARRKAEKAEAERQRFRAGAARATAIWDAAKECDSHPYLLRKGVKSHGLRVAPWEKPDYDTGEIRVITEHALLVPVRDARKRIHSLQAIYPQQIGSRDKDFLKDGAKRGFFYSIGKPLTEDIRGVSVPVIIICEGYATGATLHEATGHAVVVAFDAGNLVIVARTIRDVFGSACIVMAADNDRWTETPIPNPGVSAAKEAVAAIAGVLMVPDFSDLESKPTDFNDLARLDGAEAVKLAFDNAINPPPPVAAPTPLAVIDAPADKGALLPDPEIAEFDGVPENNAHFTILGYDHGNYYIFQHGKQQICQISKGDISETGLIELAPLNWWEINFAGDRGALNRKSAANFIFRIAEKRGIYDNTKRRGRGAWIDEGRVVFHHGSTLSVDNVPTRISQIKSHYVYELAKSLPLPADEPMSSASGQAILEMAKSFRWTKPGSAPLLVGWSALAPLCGALPWRPHIWLTGGAGSGKSTVLNKFLHFLCAGQNHFAQGSSSEAGIRQTLETDAMPVLYDESEQNNDREKNRVEAILGLIRQASTESDALTLKGTAGGNAMNFHIRSMFCLASIQVGMKHQADVERLSVLALKPKGGETNASESWIKLRESLYNLHRDAMLPAKLLRRSLNLLPTTLRNIETFSQAAAEIFNSQRDGDQYGTLMAGCWSVVSEAVATKDDALAMIRAYDWSDHRENNDTDEGQRALGTLMEAHVRPGGGVDLTVNELVCAAAGQPTTAVDISADKANALLQRYGMKINGERLLLSTNSKELDRLIAGTQFQADLHGMLRRLPGANNFAGKPMRFSGVQSKCTSLPLDLVMNLGWSWEDDQPPL